MVTTVIGLGLIGGSMALDLKKRGFSERIIGVDNNVQHANIAQVSGIIDEISTLSEAAERSGLIIIATPINATKTILQEILDLIANTDKVVTDVGSTKAGIAERVKVHPGRKNYVASHPMAGTEFSGPLAAVSKLFDFKIAIICDKELSSDQALKTVENMYETLNMKRTYMNSREHDVSAAYVSHMSHISSFALSLAVLEKERDEKRILDLASGGFESTVRLAKSSPEMWAPIFEQNAENVVEVLDTYIEKLNLFREFISQKKHEEIYELIQESNKIQKIL